MTRASATVTTGLLAAMLAAATAYALPRAGSQAPSARTETVDGKVLEPRSLRGKIALIFYEDKDSTQQNKVLKGAITEQGRTRGTRRTSSSSR